MRFVKGFQKVAYGLGDATSFPINSVDSADDKSTPLEPATPGMFMKALKKKRSAVDATKEVMANS